MWNVNGIKIYFTQVPWSTEQECLGKKNLLVKNQDHGYLKSFYFTFSEKAGKTNKDYQIITNISKIVALQTTEFTCWKISKFPNANYAQDVLQKLLRQQQHSIAITAYKSSTFGSRMYREMKFLTAFVMFNKVEVCLQTWILTDLLWHFFWQTMLNKCRTKEFLWYVCLGVGKVGEGKLHKLSWEINSLP